MVNKLGATTQPQDHKVDLLNGSIDSDTDSENSVSPAGAPVYPVFLEEESRQDAGAGTDNETLAPEMPTQIEMWEPEFKLSTPAINFPDATIKEWETTLDRASTPENLQKIQSDIKSAFYQEFGEELIAALDTSDTSTSSFKSKHENSMNRIRDILIAYGYGTDGKLDVSKAGELAQDLVENYVRVGTSGGVASILNEFVMAVAYPDTNSFPTVPEGNFTNTSSIASNLYDYKGRAPIIGSISTQDSSGKEIEVLTFAGYESSSSNVNHLTLEGQIVNPGPEDLEGALMNALVSQEVQEMTGRSMEGFIWPTTGMVTSIYGWRWGRMHQGIDIAAPVGTPIVTVADGVVDFVGSDPNGYGNFVDILHSDGTITRYGHNDTITVALGQRVSKGQKIAAMGSTGHSTGSHLHFEIIAPNGERINPNHVLPNPSGFGVTISKGPVFNGGTLSWDFGVYDKKQ